MSGWDGRLILHSDADAFFASVEQVCNPILQGKPVIVCGVPSEKSVVTAASYEGKKYGIKAGMPVFQAKRLLPRGFYVPVDIPKYIYYSTLLLSIYLKYTKIVEAYSIDEAFLDCTGQTEEPQKLGLEIKECVKRETGLTVSLGIAPNKLMAKIASEYRKPDGLWMIRPDEIQLFLANQPVKMLIG